MAQDTNISIAAAKAALNSVVDLLDVGTTGNARLQIWSGAQPASPDVATPTGTKLAEIDLGAATIFSAAGTSGNSATATASGILPKTCTSATASGTGAWFRATNKDGTAVIDGTVGTASADLILNNTSIATGQSVKLNSWKVKLPKL